MNRRKALGGLLTLTAMPVWSRVNAQVAKRDGPFRITTFPDLSPLAKSWFLDAMRKVGWTDGVDFVLQSGIQYGVSQRELQEAVERIVAGKPDLVFTQTTAYALAMHQGTTSIPIVMATSGYPVEAGLAQTLARPGKNVTGNAVYAGMAIWSKLVQLLREAKPGVRRISVLWTYVRAGPGNLHRTISGVSA